MDNQLRFHNNLLTTIIWKSWKNNQDWNKLLYWAVSSNFIEMGDTTNQRKKMVNMLHIKSVILFDA